MFEPNLLAVLVAGVIPLLLGALWYGPLFGKKWMQLVEKSEEELRAGFNPLKSFGGTFVVSLVSAYVLAHVIEHFAAAYDIDGWPAGVNDAFWMWLGFQLTVGWQNVAFERKKVGLFLLNSSYNLVSLLAMGVLLGIWR